jgi:acetolactate synthase-1/2/3 large subunit
MMKLSEYVITRLADWGVRDIFLLTGGGAMHLNDSIGREHRIRYLCTHHEQAAAMAAESYARITGRPGVLNVTTGPGGINALNGVFGAWTDSIPMLVISGQVKRETCMATYGLTDLRQLGDQEVDIIRMVKGITKYSVWVNEPETIAYHLERAWYLAQHGRPGPCWIDIPVDVQSAMIDVTSLRGYNEKEDAIVWNREQIREQARDLLERLRNAERPVIMVGTGIRAGHAEKEFYSFIDKLGVPVTTAWTAHDLMPRDHPLYAGRPSSVGDRAGNLAVQNSDLLLVLGCRLHMRQISYNMKSFARYAYKVQVDADSAEFVKPTMKPDMAIHSDIGVFFEAMQSAMKESGYAAQHGEWVSWCKQRLELFPPVLPSQRSDNAPLNPYHFIEILFDLLVPDDVVVCGDGAACVVPFQVGRIQRGQRLYTNAGSASMGYDIPAAIGAAVARQGKRVVCLAGDGSCMLNIQELQTIVHHKLPIKIFILNNGGYLSIRTTQNSHFGGNLVGEGPTSGVTFPDMLKLAAAYGIPASRVEDGRCAEEVRRVLEAPGPSLCEVMLDTHQTFEPRLASRLLPDGSMTTPALENMFPFLETAELRKHLLGPLAEEYRGQKQ